MARHDPIVPAPPDPATPIGQVVILYRDLLRAQAAHGFDSPEADAVRDALRPVWDAMSGDEMREAIDAVAPMMRRQSNAEAMVQVNELFAAGWMPEFEENGDRDPHAWAWRRPPRRVGAAGTAGRGKRYASTGQAHGAMTREAR